MTKIAPSILSADFAMLEEEIKDVEQGGADYIHIDVMDGHFVPNITIGPMIVEAIRPVTNLPLDVHLMIENPDQYIETFTKSGADLLSVHVEACHHLHKTIQHIKSEGIRAGVVLNPHTPVSMIEHVIEDVDLVLLMTVNPGFGGQSFIKSVLPKIRQIATIVEKRELKVEIEVDGGINPETAKLCIDAGANVLVAGSAIYNQTDRGQAIRSIRVEKTGKPSFYKLTHAD
ncbi:ribulose-5-phosphate 3-epimerase [Scopulibacillus darangshiensis]|uniref:Ribulose-phosphate 3-epimerase n=1 Tax=Scopulibacillus darangshiensis TaxID=442528 RepID=A0A4R2NZW2_9BACL|nr:ribulose-phosphate 3-epimerase [Scopulibacillus darangshiensis]TCP27782.1 ribulose-5-phosphate 3-epimerase [Scopulibacillus darangshiensis]